MRIEEFYFDSRDGKSKIHTVCWMPEGEPKAILQIVHGMAEYIERYQAFAEIMTENGFCVVGDDHLGHGKTASFNEAQQGYFCEQDAATVLVRDEHRLKKLMQEKFPGKPYYIMGHSMGSFITRNYLCNYGTGIQGAIIMGTGMQPKGLLMASRLIAGIQKKLFGEHHVAKFIDRLAFGSYNKKIEQPRTAVDWLTKDESQVDKYVAHPDCGFVFTVNGFATLFELIWRLHNPNNLERMPKDLPLFLVAGAADPVGDYGKAVTKVYESYKKLGLKDVSLKLYDNDRHELLNETDWKDVTNDILNWLNNQLKAS